MKKNVSELSFFAILLATVLAEFHAGATVVEPDEHPPGRGSLSETVLSLPADVLRDALVGHDSGGTPPGSTSDPAMLWPDRLVPGESPGTWSLVDDSAPIAVTPTFEKGGTTPPTPGENHRVDYRPASPFANTGDMAAWKYMDSPMDAESEAWLLRLPIAKSSNSQRSGPEPFIPIPEPPTATLVLTGIAGIFLRKWYG